MNGLVCTRCMAGTLVDIDDGTVCTFCRTVTSRPVAVRPTDQAILEFAAAHPRIPGDGAVRRALGVSVLRYVQRLNRLLDSPEVPAAHRGLVARLRAERDWRDRQRRGAA